MTTPAQFSAPRGAAAGDMADTLLPRILGSLRADPDPGQMEATLRNRRLADRERALEQVPVCTPNVHQRQHLPQACEANDVVRRRIEALAHHLSTARDLMYIHTGSAYDHVERAQNLAAALLDEASTVTSPPHQLDDLDAAEPPRQLGPSAGAPPDHA